MKKLLGMALGIAALAIPGIAQTHAGPQQTTLRNAAYQYGYQDQDDRNHDRDDRDRNYQNGQNGQYGNRNHGTALAPEWQSKFDSYYQRWLQYRASNDRDQMNSMAERMYQIMDNYHIPRNVPFSEVASQGGGGSYNNNGYSNGGNYGRGDHDRDDNNRGYGRATQISPSDQQRFDSYYQRWMRARSTNDRDDMQSMEQRMRGIYSQYNIPPNTPFDQVAGGGGYRR